MRTPHHHRGGPGGNVTDHGRAVAVLFTKAHGRALAPGLVQLDLNLPADIAARSPLAQAWRRLDSTLDD